MSMTAIMARQLAVGQARAKYPIGFISFHNPDLPHRVTIHVIFTLQIRKPHLGTVKQLAQFLSAKR